MSRNYFFTFLRFTIFLFLQMSCTKLMFTEHACSHLSICCFQFYMLLWLFQINLFTYLLYTSILCDPVLAALLITVCMNNFVQTLLSWHSNPPAFFPPLLITSKLWFEGCPLPSVPLGQWGSFLIFLHKHSDMCQAFPNCYR